VAAFAYLTDAQARTLARHELLERIADQQAYYENKRRKSSADEAAMDELSQIIHRCLNIDAAFDAAFATVDGYTGTSYWDTRPTGDRVTGPQATTTAARPSSAASPQEQTAAVLARLTPERLERLTRTGLADKDQ